MARNVGGFGAVRKQDKFKGVFIVGILFCVLLGSIGTIIALRPSKQVKVADPVKNDVEMVDVLIPAKQFDAGTMLEPGQFKVEKRPKDSVPMRAIVSLEQVNGYYARTAILPNQPFSVDYLTRVKPTNVLTANIPDGFRAVTIRVDERSGVEGWARPGAKVDVVWVTIINGKQTVKTIVFNAKVLSAGQQAEGAQQVNPQQSGASPTTVTLLVSVDDSKRIQLATTIGSLSLSLRGDKDSELPSVESGFTIDDVLGVETKKVEEKCHAKVKIKRPDGGMDIMCLRDGELFPMQKK